MQATDQERLAAALRFALQAHGEQKRKGTQIPYVSHLLRVSGLVMEHGGDADQAVAALLHDTIEDCEGVTAEGLRQRFGSGVSEMVCSLSDVLEGDSPGRKSPWRERKERYLAHLASTDPRTRLIAACDKVDNLRSLLADLEVDGVATLERFSGTPRQTRWYYEEVEGIMGAELPIRLRRELAQLLRELRGFIPEASPEP